MESPVCLSIRVCHYSLLLCLLTDRLETKNGGFLLLCVPQGIHYQNVWMYVVHELEDAIGDCKNGQVGDNDAGVHAWDEGWAFYAGSLLVGTFRLVTWALQRRIWEQLMPF